MLRGWLKERWDVVIPLLSSLGLEQEEEIARFCAEEIDAWRARDGMQLSSLRNPMTQTRNELKRVLPVNDATKWHDAKTGKWFHIALKYFNFSREEWTAMNAPSEEKFEERLAEQKEIDYPGIIVERAEALLRSDRWEDVAVGLGALTGRRLTEVLKVGVLYQSTPFTVLFDGQLKRRDVRLPPYEIPTLIWADKVIAGWSRLRGLLDLSRMDVQDVAPKYSGLLGDNVTRHFAELIPIDEEEDEQIGKKKGRLHFHLLRGVYGRIAFYWFSPVRELAYAPAILGHYKLSGVVTDRERLNFLSAAHYFDYRIANEDGRYGVRLGEPGVQPLQMFQKKEKGKTMSDGTQDAVVETDETLEAKDAGKTIFSMLKPTKATRGRVDKLMERKGFRTHDEAISYLLEQEVIADQFVSLLEPYSAGSDSPVATLRAIITGYEAASSLPDFQDISALVADVATTEEQPIEYLQELLQKDRHIREALRNRHADVDYASLSLAELGKIKTPESAVERYRRAVDAIIAHNLSQTEPLRRWYINAVEINALVGGQNKSIQSYLLTRKDELDQHHAALGLTPRFNRKPVAITDDIKNIA